jgi:glycosyltransferase involved in cell wall biosynthesis
LRYHDARIRDIPSEDRFLSTADSIPDYVKSVKSELSAVVLDSVRSAPNRLPDRQSPIVLSVVRNEAERLPDFFRHYRSLGIERFAIVDNGSVDGTTEYLLEQEDVDLYSKRGLFHWTRKQAWINRLIAIYGYDRWFLAADADEQLVYDRYESIDILQLVSQMEKNGIRRVRGFMLDMYADGPLRDYQFDPSKPLLKSYPLHDAPSSYEERRFKELISVKGGPRSRMRSDDPTFRPEMTKYPLFHIRDDELFGNPHLIWPHDENFLSDRYLCLLHFKYLPSFKEKVADAVIQKNYWRDSSEYVKYHEILSDSKDFSLVYEGSTPYQSSRKLVEAGLIAEAF